MHSNFDEYLLQNSYQDDLEMGNSTSVDPCLICTREDKSMYKLNCDHVFCKSCIRRWLAHNKTCPICRRDASISHMTPLRDEDDTCKNCCGNGCYACKISCQKNWCGYLSSFISASILVVLLGAGAIFIIAFCGVFG